MLKRALSRLNTAFEMYAEMLFDDRTHIARQNAGYICDFLSIAIMHANGTFFLYGQSGQLEELRKLKNVPDGFISLYEKIVNEKNPDAQKKLCYSLLVITREFLMKLSDRPQQKKRRASELTYWYHELSYTWRRVRYFCQAGDSASAFLWACMLQNEIGIVTQDYDIPDISLLDAFDASNLNAFAAHADKTEQEMIRAIEADGGKLDLYVSIDEFLKKN